MSFYYCDIWKIHIVIGYWSFEEPKKNQCAYQICGYLRRVPHIDIPEVYPQLHGKKVSMIINYTSGTLPETNSSHLKQWHPKRKQIFQHLPFSGAMSVSFREGKCRFCRPLQSSYSWRKTRRLWSLYLRIPAWLATEPQTQKGQPHTHPETNVWPLEMDGGNDFFSYWGGLSC